MCSAIPTLAELGGGKERVSVPRLVTETDLDRFLAEAPSTRVVCVAVLATWYSPSFGIAQLGAGWKSDPGCCGW